MANCQWINNKSVDFYNTEQCTYMREGEGSILGTSKLTKLLKIDIFVSLCDNSAHKRAGKQKYKWIVKIYKLCGERIKLVKNFQNREGQSNI